MNRILKIRPDVHRSCDKMFLHVHRALGEDVPLVKKRNLCYNVRMEEYGRFSEVYDLLMENIPYEDWCSYLTGLLCRNGVRDGLVCELGCGTGNMTELLAENGYDMTGIDFSETMLQQAMEKRERSGLPILYLLQDMREIELYGTMKAFVSVCDSMNYLTDPEDFLEVLRLVNNYLDPGGVFIFDLKTEHFFREVLGDATSGASEEHAAYILENEYDEEEKLNSSFLTVFEEAEDGRFERFTELHEQRAYGIEELQALAAEAGLEFTAAYDAFTEEPPREDSERIYIVLRECMKTDTPGVLKETKQRGTIDE